MLTPFKEKAALVPIPQAQTQTVNQYGKQKEGSDLSPSHTKLRTPQVMGLNINTLEVRRTT